jgi:hypothetical protein
MYATDLIAALERRPGKLLRLRLADGHIASLRVDDRYGPDAIVILRPDSGLFTAGRAIDSADELAALLRRPAPGQTRRPGTTGVFIQLPGAEAPVGFTLETEISSVVLVPAQG